MENVSEFMRFFYIKFESSIEAFNPTADLKEYVSQIYVGCDVFHRTSAEVTAKDEKFIAIFLEEILAIRSLFSSDLEFIDHGSFSNEV